MAGKVLAAFVLVAIVLVAFGFYVSYREKGAASVAHITSLAQIQGVPPTVCSYQVGSYGGGSGGDLYIANNLIRISVPDLESGGYSGSAEAVLGTDGTRLIDPASKSSLSGGEGVAYALNMVITQAPWECGPWWFSDSTLFTIPNAVTF